MVEDRSWCATPEGRSAIASSAPECEDRRRACGFRYGSDRTRRGAMVQEGLDRSRITREAVGNGSVQPLRVTVATHDVNPWTGSAGTTPPVPSAVGRQRCHASQGFCLPCGDRAPTRSGDRIASRDCHPWRSTAAPPGLSASPLRTGASDRLESTGAVTSFAAEIDAPGLRRTPRAGEGHAGMANGTDGLDSWTALQFEPGRGDYQGG
jgi:hypothetical protein